MKYKPFNTPQGNMNPYTVFNINVKYFETYIRFRKSNNKTTHFVKFIKTLLIINKDIETCENNITCHSLQLINISILDFLRGYLDFQ